ncbi:rotamase, partial [Stenotrophomonas terrae]
HREARQVFRLREGLAGFPVESRWGYHVVSVDAVETGQALSFDQVRAQISDYLELQVRQRDLQQFLLELRERYPVRGLEDIEAQAE